MHIRTPKDWELPESAVTPEPFYRLSKRRDFLKAMGVTAVAIAARDAIGAPAPFQTKPNPAYRDPALKPTAYEHITSYNNFYEFGTDKSEPRELANRGWKTEPWTVEITGLVNNPFKFGLEDIAEKIGGYEQRVYRMRCVERWSMVIPWDGFQLSKLLVLADPKPAAKFVKFTTFLDKKAAPGQADGNLDYPYVEGLRLDEAMNELSFIATGIYGRAIPNQNGAPLRLVTPWKYGFKGIKSIVKIELTDKQPRGTWEVMQAREYGFYANVNPTVDHPRWSQSREQIIGGGVGALQKTLMFNGYEKQVAALYQGMDLKKNY